jgi:hypothetical protein
MAITPPTVGVLFVQAEVNNALAAICAFIDADRVRLDTTEPVATGAQTEALAAKAQANEIRRRLRKARSA